MISSDLNLLLEVQELDKEIAELNSQLSKYPSIWEETKKSLIARKNAIGEARENKEKHHKERRRAEQKLRLFSDDMRRFQTQLNQIKTAKEYEAINKQIEATRQKIAQVEEQALELINQDETVDKAIGIAEQEAVNFEQFAKKEKERIRVQFNEKKSRIEELEREKKRMLANVDPAMIQTYERISRRYPGSAVVTVRSGSCSGCHFRLLPNTLVMVHRQERLVICPNCDRILGRDEEYTGEAVAE